MSNTEDSLNAALRSIARRLRSVGAGAERDGIEDGLLELREALQSCLGAKDLAFVETDAILLLCFEIRGDARSV